MRPGFRSQGADVALRVSAGMYRPADHAASHTSGFGIRVIRGAANPRLLALVFACACCSLPAARADVVIENHELRLVLADDARVVSLLHRPSRTECVAPDSDGRAFSTLLHRGYLGNNGPRIVPATAVRREGDRLLVSFAPLVSRAVIRLRISDTYIGFILEKIEGDASYAAAAGKTRPAYFNEDTLPFDELCFLQLPVKGRGRFGDWLNVAWDDRVAVNLLATSVSTRIDAGHDTGRHVLRATAVGEVRPEGIGAALIVAETSRLLDQIGRVEEDFGLPAGVIARRRPDAALSYWRVTDPITVANAERYIRVARAAGLRHLLLYHWAFARTVGHFPWREEYPRGVADLRATVDRLTAAGITTGLHLHFTKARVEDAYVQPVPDRRLNLRRHFTLARAVAVTASEMEVLENPANCTLDEGRRLLRFGDELIAYRDYTTEPPFRFFGCGRGALGSTAAAHAAGSIGGLLDVDNWPVFVRFNQRTDIQQEVAGRLARLYADAGFRFTYFDGSEDVHPPYWFNVPHAQWLVYRELQPPPLFSETSTLAHFNWHMMSRSNAEDPVAAEELKDFIRNQRIPEAAARARNFTRCNFGWIRFRPPGRGTAGIQPDIIEYATSRAAGWDCPISVMATLQDLDASARTTDNLEIIRRWEEVRATNWLTAAQRRELQRASPEHTLLVDENGRFELVPCRPIAVGPADGTARGMLFQRRGGTWVACWDTRGAGRWVVPLRAAQVRRFRVLGQELAVENTAAGLVLEISDRHYLEIRGASVPEVEAAFAAARTP